MTPTAQPSGAGRLLLKVLLISMPFIFLLISYFVFDPFSVLYRYQRFDNSFQVIPNWDYVSTQMYLNAYRQRPYSSFILGNSRTIAFTVRDWTPYIGDTLAFHYDAAGESLYGVWKKLEFLEQHGSSLKNVLLIGDTDLLKQISNNEAGHLTRKDPRTINTFPLSFQLSFVKAYLSNLFFYRYLRYRATGTFTPEMEGLFESRPFYYDPVTNDMSVPGVDESIERDSLAFYAHNSRLLASRKPGTSPAVIGAAQLQQLVAIRNVFKRHRTDFHFVISPLFQQQQLNPADLAILQRTFGANRVHDFSGVNEFTASPGNYYEESHYRPLVGRQILQRIYSAALPAE